MSSEIELHNCHVPMECHGKPTQNFLTSTRQTSWQSKFHHLNEEQSVRRCCDSYRLDEFRGTEKENKPTCHLRNYRPATAIVFVVFFCRRQSSSSCSGDVIFPRRNCAESEIKSSSTALRRSSIGLEAAVKRPSRPAIVISLQNRFFFFPCVSSLLIPLSLSWISLSTSSITRPAAIPMHSDGKCA